MLVRCFWTVFSKYDSVSSRLLVVVFWGFFFLIVRDHTLKLKAKLGFINKYISLSCPPCMPQHTNFIPIQFTAPFPHRGILKGSKQCDDDLRCMIIFMIEKHYLTIIMWYWYIRAYIVTATNVEHFRELSSAQKHCIH